MNMAPLLWTLQFCYFLFCIYGSHMIDPYSIIDLTRAKTNVYTVLLHSLGQCCRFLLRNPSQCGTGFFTAYRWCFYVPSIWGLLVFVVLLLGRGLMVLVQGFGCLMCRSDGSSSSCLGYNTFWHWNAFPSLMPISLGFLGRFVGWYGHFRY